MARAHQHLDQPISRKDFLLAAMVATGSLVASPSLLAEITEEKRELGQDDELTAEDLARAEKVAGIQFTEEQRQQILRDVNTLRREAIALREKQMDYSVEPPTLFRPIEGPPGRPVTQPRGGPVAAPLGGSVAQRTPSGEEELHFKPLTELARMVRSREVSPVELTRLYLQRLEQYGEKLLCVVTLTPELAMRQARKAEQEIMSGNYKGVLHGIPCGIKDLFATKEYPTTWGAEPFKDQRFDYDAAVVEKLDRAGAVIVAKLSLGALAMGDVWFRGTTKNPWNPEQGSSGSSAGSASATVAGLVGFAIGTETLGSIVSPSHRCRVTGLRPTYGRVSRYGAMAVSWTMDKIGPICRTAEDCYHVLKAIAGADPRDPSSTDRVIIDPNMVDSKRLRVGYLPSGGGEGTPEDKMENDPIVRIFRGMGYQIRLIEMPELPDAVTNILGVEAAAAFDDFTLGPEIEKLGNSAWPRIYRSNRYVTGVDYLRAMRARTVLMREYAEKTKDYDVFISPQRGLGALTITNFTGHPQMFVPTPENDRGFSIVGTLYHEEQLVALAMAFQAETGSTKLHPDMSKIG
ncbi:MAG: amidase [Armatimonadota bacterium]